MAHRESVLPPAFYLGYAVPVVAATQVRLLLDVVGPGRLPPALALMGAALLGLCLSLMTAGVAAVLAEAAVRVVVRLAAPAVPDRLRELDAFGYRTAAAGAAAGVLVVAPLLAPTLLRRAGLLDPGPLMDLAVVTGGLLWALAVPVLVLVTYVHLAARGPKPAGRPGGEP